MGDCFVRTLCVRAAAAVGLDLFLNVDTISHWDDPSQLCLAGTATPLPPGSREKAYPAGD